MKSRVPSLRYRLGRPHHGREQIRRSAARRCVLGVYTVNETHQVLMSSSIARTQPARRRISASVCDVETGTGRVHEVAVRVDADAGSPHVDLVPDRAAPQPAVRVGEPGHDRAAVDDQAEVLAHRGHARGQNVVAAPQPDVDVPVGVRHERRPAGHECLAPCGLRRSSRRGCCRDETRC